MTNVNRSCGRTSPASDAVPFGPVTSELMRYLASIAMTAAATVVAVGVDTTVTIPTCPWCLSFQ